MLVLLHYFVSQFIDRGARRLYFLGSIKNEKIRCCKGKNTLLKL